MRREWRWIRRQLPNSEPAATLTALADCDRDPIVLERRQRLCRDEARPRPRPRQVDRSRTPVPGGIEAALLIRVLGAQCRGAMTGREVVDPARPPEHRQ